MDEKILKIKAELICCGLIATTADADEEERRKMAENFLKDLIKKYGEEDIKRALISLQEDMLKLRR